MFADVFRNKRVLVSGITGFKGTWLGLWLKKLGADIYGIADRIPTQPSLFECLKLEDHISYYQEDVRELSRMVEIVSDVKPSYVFHLAAQPIVKIAYEDPISTLSTNILGTAHILEALRICNNPCSAVMITSDKCYDNVEWIWGYRENDRLAGKDPYSASKSAAELVIRTYYFSFFQKPASQVRVVSTRAGNVIGGGDWASDRIVPDCIRAWSGEKPVEIRSPNTTRPWQHVLEPLSGYLRCGQLLSQGEELNGEAFNFGPSGEQNATVLELLKELASHWHFPAGSEHYKIVPQETFHEAALLKLNCDKALTQLSWKPVLNVEESARFTASWYNGFYNKSDFSPWDYSSSQIEQYIHSAEEKNLAWLK